jgi:hypothetical protein
MWPPGLSPTDHLVLRTPSATLAVPVCRPELTPWTAPTDLWTFGQKALVESNGQPVFAELAILRAFEAAGWEGRWVETYGHWRNPRFWVDWRPGKARDQQHVPIPHGWIAQRLQQIADAKGGSHGGCPDLVLWRGQHLLFVECKRRGKDRFRPTQVRWLQAALECGVRMEEVVVVEWELGAP